MSQLSSNVGRLRVQRMELNFVTIFPKLNFTRSKMNANKKQVGGGHYQSEIQHWDYVLANNIPYLEAQIIKYVTRWRAKNGYQDLQKAQHFLEKLMEVNAPKILAPKEHKGILGDIPQRGADVINRDPTKVPEYKSDDVALNPTKPWPGRLYCTCELNGPIACLIHKYDGSHPGPGYVNQDR